MLPIYYSKVAGATLPSKATATGYWMTTGSISLLIVALIAPVLGTVADVMRGKKKLLSVFLGVGVVATGLLVLVDTGDWFLASLIFIVGRVGFACANVFYDSLLPHVAREEDRDRVSATGYAIGYLGGGILLAVNAAMILLLTDSMGTWATRLCFLSVAIWWAAFSIPLFRHVPEPPSAESEPNGGALGTSLRRLRETFRGIRRYRQLGRFLIAFLIYNDGIGTIIGAAAIYGTELGFRPTELILAVLLVQFAGIPFSLVFGRIPTRGASRRGFCLALIFLNVLFLPVVGFVGSRALDGALVGARPPPFPGNDRPLTEDAGEDWEVVRPDALGSGAETEYLVAVVEGAGLRFRFHGRRLEVLHAVGPEESGFEIRIDGALAATVERDGRWAKLPGPRFGESVIAAAREAGEHEVEILKLPGGKRLALGGIVVLPPERTSNLIAVFGILAALEVLCVVLSLALGERLFGRWATAFDARRTLFLALFAYGVISLWGFCLDAVLEFWFLAFLVAVVQGGSQALSRSLYAALSPKCKSGEFFAFFSVMAKFSAVLGPLVFVAAIALTGTSRPALLGVFCFFVAGAWVLRSVDVEEGRRIAREEDAAAAKSSAP